MPYRFDFDSTNQILRGRIDGSVTEEDLKAFYLLACAIAKVVQPRAAIADFSAVTDLNFGLQTLHDLAKFPPVLPDPNQPRVILAPSEDAFGLARVFQHNIEDTRPNVHVVHKWGEACAILGIQTLEFEEIRPQ
jgi:hypothetical protein